MMDIYDTGYCAPTHRGAAVTILGEAPSDCEVGECDCPKGIHPLEGFVGPAGKILDIGLDIGGLPREGVNFTNISKRRLKKNDFGQFYEMKKDGRRNLMEPTSELIHWEDELRRELEEHRPNVVLACGQEALRTMCMREGISHWRGSVIESTLLPGMKVIPMLHPSGILRGFNYQELFIWGLIIREKVVKEMQFPEIRMKPWGSVYEPTPAAFAGLVKAIVDKGWRWSFDIETLKKKPVVKCFGVGWRDDKGDDYGVCVPIQTVSGPYYTPSDELAMWKSLIYLADKNPHLVISNGVFDLDHVFDYGVCPSGIFMDLLLQHNRLYPELPKSVEFMNMLYCDIPYYKAEGKSTSSRQVDSDLWSYNIKDVISELRISYALEEKARLLDKEQICLEVHQMWPIALEMQRLGLPIDEAAYGFARDTVREAFNQVTKKRKAITGDINLRSPKDLPGFLYGPEPGGLGLPVKRKRGKSGVTADEKAIVELMMRHPDKEMALKLILAEKKLLKAKDYSELEVVE